MKKLALALMCLVSVAFFASCDPNEILNPEPTLAVVTGDNYAYDGMTIDLNTDFKVGFRAASNTQTLKELSKFNLSVKLFDLENTEIGSSDTTYAISGNEFSYDETWAFTNRELIAKAVFTATVTDVDAKVKTVILNININQPALPLEVRDLRWYRWGNTIEGLDEFGLRWAGNYQRDYYAKIEPKDGVKLFAFTAEDWANVVTDVDKAELFANAIENQHTLDNYFNINVTQGTMTYNDVIGTVLADGTCHLMHIVKSTTVNHGAQGAEITINGEAK